MGRRLLISVSLAAAICGGLAQTMRRGNTRSPHGDLKMPCGTCHTSISWKPLRAAPEFNHNRDTKYPLRAMHARVECRSCHTNLVFKEASTRCADCHADIHRSQFGARCEDCHSVRGWQVGTQSVRTHSARFPLLGAHATVDCESCHRGAGAAQFTGLSTQCASCHIADFNNAKIIDHRAAGFSTQCQMCHTFDNWGNVNFLNGRFNHALTRFPLTGAHLTTPCLQCHVNNQFVGLSTQCASCHMASFTTATDPNHVTAGFPTDCSLCHSTVNWLNAVFDHSRTSFPLTGAHAPLQCAQCHTNNTFVGLSNTCVSCHLTDFNKATNPNHITSAFPQQCEVCHTATAWSPASFNHNSTPFPLTGAHVNVACTSCHVNNVFQGTPTDCYSCHKPEYQSTTNPNHTSAGYPTTCANCHATTSWAGATATHNQFPIYSGTHARVWTTCADCHTNPSNFQAFSCINCHTHDQAGTDPHHRGVRNYVYAPTSCYSCHPNGSRGR